jgi:glycosyltransferase involved in cell wall biosynthesis
MKAVRAEHKREALSLLIAAARWVATRQAASTLRKCDAIVAVSRYVRDELATSGRLDGSRLYNVPNLVDLNAVDRAARRPWPLSDISPKVQFALFVGKLDTNKGATLLPEAVERGGLRLPTVILGSGPLQDEIGAEARTKELDFRFYSWLDNDDVLRVMRSARVLLFPSAWQEPLSRVLLEGCAASAATVALNTGGTGDIIEHGVSGWLAGDLSEFVEGIRIVASDDTLNRSLRVGARAKVERVFSSPRVAGEMADLYYAVLDEQRGNTQ